MLPSEHAATARGRRAPVLAVCAAAALALIATGRMAAAAPITGSFGYEQGFGPDNQVVKSGLLIAEVSTPRFSVFAAPSRYDHSAWGSGYGLAAGMGVAVARSLALHTSAARFVADGGGREGWRFRGGPSWGWSAGPRLTVSYVHDQSTNVLPGNGMAMDLSAPLVPRLQGNLGMAWLARGAATDVAAAVGAVWTMVPSAELLTQVGVAKSGLSVGGLGANGGSDGGAGSTTQASGPEPTASLGLRFKFRVGP